MTEQVHVNDLIAIIGQQQVELVVLRARVAQLLARLSESDSTAGVSDSVAERHSEER